MKSVPTKPEGDSVIPCLESHPGFIDQFQASMASPTSPGNSLRKFIDSYKVGADYYVIF